MSPRQGDKLASFTGSSMAILTVLHYCNYIYLAYVQPHLEYAVPVWDPYQQGLINLLESVQKFALKVCIRNWAMDYGSLLNFCNLPTLASRRQYLKLFFLYQVIHGNFIFPNVPLERHSIPLNLRSTSPFLLYRLLTCTNAYQYSSFSPCKFLYGKSCPPFCIT